MYMTQPLHRMMREAPDAIAAIDGLDALSWQQLRDRVARNAGALRAKGLEPGEPVAILAHNSVDYLAWILAIWWAGGVINPVNLRWAASEIAYSLDNCGTRILIVDDKHCGMVPAIRESTSDLRRVVSTGAAGDTIESQAEWVQGIEPVEDALRKGDDHAAILYTGGTTGFPKGVMLSHGNLAASVLGALSLNNQRVTDRYLHCAPMFHIGSLSGIFLTLFSGRCSAFLPAFEPVAMLEAINSWEITEFFVVPTMLKMLVQHPRFAEFDVSGIRHIRYGASPIDGALLDHAIELFPNAHFSQAYGMTELSPVVTILGPEDHRGESRTDLRLRSAGKATATYEVRIVDAEDNEVPRGEVGEIVARGPGVMLGYWKQPEATAEALRGGWMHTGDMGRMDEDGYVTVVDRLKDMIVTGGENVYSAEVENALAAHPAIAACAVIAAPDEEWGERVHAVIVPRAGEAPSPESITAHCRTLIAGYKLPRSFDFVDALPLTAAGKVDKNALRKTLKG